MESWICSDLKDCMDSHSEKNKIEAKARVEKTEDNL